MADMIRDNLPWFSETLQDYGSTLLTYRRGASSVSILMTVGSKPVPMLDVLGNTPGPLDQTQQNPKNAVRSFTFNAEDLDFGAGPIEPDEGDEILETHGGVVHVYRCMPPDSGLLAWEYIGQHRGEGARVRVHTQEVDTV